ncbi:MAG TPA: GyrI-like domain-containing protein [Candidatus Krumholzibacteria bacterium]|nr:GyrI-like domain-containing protein [Candidatus Krumholzibacteria bacterium]
MLEQPQIAKVTARPAAVVHITVPREKIREVMGPGYHELMSTLAAQGVKPAGPWFSHHFTIDPKVFDFEIGVPVDGPFEPRGRVRVGELPAATVARTVYRGGYEGLPGAWGEFEAWIKQEGLKPAASLWETYTRGPESGSDDSTWETELTRPLSEGV